MPYAIKEAGFGLGILLVLVVTAVTGTRRLMLSIMHLSTYNIKKYHTLLLSSYNSSLAQISVAF